MKLLLDENLPHELRRLLAPHDVHTAAFMGWAGLKNGDLLALAAQNDFDALISLDSGIQFGQNLGKLPCAVLLLKLPSNRLRDVRRIVPSLLTALENLPPKTLIHVEI